MTLRWNMPANWPVGSAVDRWADAELVGGQHDGHRFKVRLGPDALPPMRVAATSDEPPARDGYGDPQLHAGVWRYTYRGQG